MDICSLITDEDFIRTTPRISGIISKPFVSTLPVETVTKISLQITDSNKRTLNFGILFSVT